jgi:hypothetical protein
MFKNVETEAKKRIMKIFKQLFFSSLEKLNELRMNKLFFDGESNQLLNKIKEIKLD